ncbi:MAG: DUF1446 domain-containing protein [Dethiobacter sp.]|jgi:hypothetical protein|nr:DUF1446 domain-containing protein [Dethiobacter sp.]
MKKVRIGAGQGFLGDSPFPALDVVRHGSVKYLCCDALAELTLAILEKLRKRSTGTGWAPDLKLYMNLLLNECVQRGVKIITSAGGLNPVGAAAEIGEIAQSLGIKGLKIAVVGGDDISSSLDTLKAGGVTFENMESGVQFDSLKREDILFANVYLGAEPIIKALALGADVVVTGRCADTALFLAPMVHELGWKLDDWDKIAAGVVCGHLMECSAQSTGGNFSGDWWEVPAMHRPGYPVVEISEDGEAVLTKPEPCGGLVSRETVTEQLVYEIGDPRSYITPDVIADFTSVRLEDLGDNRVAIKGVKGRQRPDNLKVSIGYSNGFCGEMTIRYPWPHALRKAQKAEEIIRQQLKMLPISVEEIIAEYVGINSLLGPAAVEPAEELNEVGLRMAIRTRSKREAEMFPRLFPSLALNGPPGLGAGSFGAERARELISLWSALIPRELVTATVTVLEVN